MNRNILRNRSFLAGIPLGYVVGSMFVGKIKYHSRRVLMLGALVIGGLTFISLGFTYSILFAIITEVIAGISLSFFNVYNTSISQQIVPNHIMGKVVSVRLLIIRGTMPLGVLMGSIFSEVWGVRSLYLFIGAIICSVSLLGLVLPY